jgi:hypothetical protein
MEAYLSCHDWCTLIPVCVKLQGIIFGESAAYVCQTSIVIGGAFYIATISANTAAEPNESIERGCELNSNYNTVFLV